MGCRSSATSADSAANGANWCGDPAGYYLEWDVLTVQRSVPTQKDSLTSPIITCPGQGA